MSISDSITQKPHKQQTTLGIMQKKRKKARKKKRKNERKKERKKKRKKERKKENNHCKILQKVNVTLVIFGSVTINGGFLRG